MDKVSAKIVEEFDFIEGGVEECPRSSFWRLRFRTSADIREPSRLQDRQVVASSACLSMSRSKSEILGKIAEDDLGAMGDTSTPAP